MSPLAPAAPLPPLRLERDFPTWLPAMLVKELRQGLRARGFVGTLVGIQIIMALIGIFAVAGGVGSGAYALLQTGYWVMMGAQLLVVTPIRALVGLQSEIEARSVDLLLLTRLTAWRIVFGKWISLLAQAALLLVALLPYGVVRYFFGSVNLALELSAVVQMFGACAVLTAAALWASALPKLARVGFGIALVFVWQASPASVNALVRSLTYSGRGRTSSSGMLGVGIGELWPIVIDAALVLLVCLVGAIRKLAPPVDNFSPLLRVAPLVAALSALFMSSDVETQLAFTVVLTAFIAMLELGRAEDPLPMHWRRWSRHGWWGRLAGRFMQPGWASAIEWLYLLAAVAVLTCIGGPDGERWARVIVLGVTALAFPALLLSFVSARHQHRTTVYGLTLGIGSLVAAVAVNNAGGAKGSLADLTLHVLPISGFWMSTNFRQTPSVAAEALQVAVAAVVLLATLWQARPYRARRAAFESGLEAPRGAP